LDIRHLVAVHSRSGQRNSFVHGIFHSPEEEECFLSPQNGALPQRAGVISVSSLML
jgi:hypothetical protein